MQPILQNGPNEVLSVGFYGTLPTSTGGVKYILSTVDSFSKFVVIYPLKKANTLSVIRKIFNDYIPKYGRPAHILSDCGTQFTSKKWLKKLSEENIEAIFSSIRHPQSNPVERVHRELGRFFRTFVRDKHTGWARYVKIIEEIINETYHETTNFTPIELHMNIKPKRVWQKYFKMLNNNDNDDLPYERKIFLARDHMHRKLIKRANKVNKNRNHFVFNIDDLVLVKAQNVSDANDRKIAKFFNVYEGPYIVKDKIGKDTYVLFDLITQKLRGKFHLQNLKPYISKK